MIKKMIGKVTEEEKNELLALFERKLGIEELTATLDSDLLSNDAKENLQNKMVSELGKAVLNLQSWWDNMYDKYKWEKTDESRWNIDFQTCDIYIQPIISNAS